MRITYFTESLPPLTDGVARTFTRPAETLNIYQMDFLLFWRFKVSTGIPWPSGKALIFWITS